MVQKHDIFSEGTEAFLKLVLTVPEGAFSG